MDKMNLRFQKHIKIVLNHRVGEYGRILILYFIAPFLFPLFDDVLGNGFIDGLRFFPTLTEFFVIEAIVTVTLLLRFIHDVILRKTIFPIRITEKKIESAIKKLNSLLINASKNEGDYIHSLEVLLLRNQELLNNDIHT